MSVQGYYHGQGRQRTKEEKKKHPLPIVDPGALAEPSGYLASAELSAAVDVALTLGMPLLLTGEPGLGKSRLAHSIAWELGLGEPLVFPVKSDTQGRDLFYSFDTVGRFHAAQTQGAQSDPRLFLSFTALGKAILVAKDRDERMDALGPALARIDHPGTGAKRVVLIDEIDKAPRDVPNDILNEIERLSFHVPELDTLDELAGARFSLAEGENPNRPIVVITSNSEKGLPDPFLRRCVYHHLRMPKYLRDEQDPEYLVTVEDIVSRRLGERFGDKGGSLMSDAIALFRHLREQPLGYRPSLAELLNWLDLLLPRSSERGQGVPQRLRDLDRARCYDGITKCLLKNEKAQVGVEAVLDAWFEAQA